MGFETWDFILNSILFYHQKMALLLFIYFQNMYEGFSTYTSAFGFCLAFRFWEKTKTARFALHETAAFRDYLCTILEVGCPQKMFIYLANNPSLNHA